MMRDWGAEMRVGAATYLFPLFAVLRPGPMLLLMLSDWLSGANRLTRSRQSGARSGISRGGGDGDRDGSSGAIAGSLQAIVHCPGGGMPTAIDTLVVMHYMDTTV